MSDTDRDAVAAMLENLERSSGSFLEGADSGEMFNDEYPYISKGVMWDEAVQDAKRFPESWNFDRNKGLWSFVVIVEEGVKGNKMAEFRIEQEDFGNPITDDMRVSQEVSLWRYINYRAERRIGPDGRVSKTGYDHIYDRPEHAARAASKMIERMVAHYKATGTRPRWDF